jgi:putative SOS response-associated peptidase YedK
MGCDKERIAERFGIDPVQVSLAGRYNVAPTQSVMSIIDGPARKVELFQWGLIPSWAKEVPSGGGLINARAETIAEKPSFRHAFRSRRCLIPADGFYEWRRDGRVKIPTYVRLRSKEPFAFAGIWEKWTGPEGREIRSCTIITTEPNALMKPIHNRMPAILKPKDEQEWLAPGTSEVRRLVGMLRPYPDEEMEAYEVSRFVNAPGNDSAQCIEPAEGA